VSAMLCVPNDSQAASAAYLTIDKVVVLRNVSLFKDIPHEILAGVAVLLTERWIEPGERIFRKGDLGDCLYVIGSGRVRVHDGEQTLAHLEKHQFFGELSLLDAEPRSASVSAVEKSLLFRLTQSDFYSVASDRIEIAQAINRVLCQMVRKANALATASH
jgi:CRP/FNR family cyclic AMP-dependent transcriptional regulator